jgi:hypothetical protein
MERSKKIASHRVSRVNRVCVPLLTLLTLCEANLFKDWR